MKLSARSIAALAGFLLVCYTAAALGGALTSTTVDTWYTTLERPAWTPPGSVIGAVWSVLYGLMGIAAWLVWTRGGFTAQWRAMTIFGIQLALNVAWSATFFALRAPGAALVVIGLLFAAIIGTMALFSRASRPAGALLLPYLAWVGFASFLNFTIWRLNRI